MTADLLHGHDQPVGQVLDRFAGLVVSDRHLESHALAGDERFVRPAERDVVALDGLFLVGGRAGRATSRTAITIVAARCLLYPDMRANVRG